MKSIDVFAGRLVFIIFPIFAAAFFLLNAKWFYALVALAIIGMVLSALFGDGDHPEHKAITQIIYNHLMYQQRLSLNMYDCKDKNSKEYRDLREATEKSDADLANFRKSIIDISDHPGRSDYRYR